MIQRPTCLPSARHTQTQLQGLLRLAGVALMVAAAEGSASQAFGVDTPPRFRVTVLRSIGGMSALAHGTAGINSDGQVVYAYLASGTPHAWYWSPHTEYGLAGNAVHTIDSTSNASVARDINDAGNIAGYSASGRKATLWTPASGSFGTPTLFATANSEAHALSNDNPPHVVGVRHLTTTCDSTFERDEAFNWTVGGAVTALAPLSPFAGEHSIAYDIRRNGADVIVGNSEECTRAAACELLFAGTGWDDTPASAVLSYNGIRTTAFARTTFGQGVNDDGKVVGWVWFKPTNQSIDCDPTATYWPSYSSTSPVDLAAHLSPANDTSRAFAINSLTNPQVVGVNTTTDHGILWEYSGSWSSVDLDSSPSIIAACSDSAWEVREAHDINDNGWIVAMGDGSNGRHALLLTPVECPYDVNGDGFIDEYDAAEILELGDLQDPSCPMAVICRWDVDFDCDTDYDDYEAVLAYISECGDPCTCEGGSFAATGGGGLSLERFMDALAAYSTNLSQEELAEGWARFLAIYNNQ